MFRFAFTTHFTRGTLAGLTHAHSRACAAPPSPIDAILARATALTPLDWLHLAEEALDQAGRLPCATHESRREHLRACVEALSLAHECETVAGQAAAEADPVRAKILDELADALEVVSGYRDLALRGGRGPSDDDLQRLATARARVAELEAPGVTCAHCGAHPLASQGDPHGCLATRAP